MRLEWELKVLASVSALVAIILVLFAWWVYSAPRQESAVAQELTVRENAVPSESLAELTVPAVAPLEPGPEVIRGLSVMDIIGNLKYFRAEGDFVCDGPTPTTQGSGSLWKCSAPSGQSPGTYGVTVLGNGPSAVIWVMSTVRGVSEERAAGFFTYLAGLCLQETDPLNPKAWVEQNVAQGGQMVAGSAELTIYGTGDERTLQIVATGFAAD